MSSTFQRGMFDPSLPTTGPNTGMFDPDIFDTTIGGAEETFNVTVFVHGTGDINTLVHGTEEITIK